MDGREATDRECYDYTSFVSGFESNRKCLVCDEDLFEKCCKTKEEGRTSASNCFVLKHSLCWEVWPLHWPCLSRHTSCWPECRWTNSVLVKFCVLSEVLSITRVHVLKKSSYLGNFILSLRRTLQNSLFEWNVLLFIAEITTSVHVYAMCIKFWMCWVLFVLLQLNGITGIHMYRTCKVSHYSANKERSRGDLVEIPNPENIYFILFTYSTCNKITKNGPWTSPQERKCSPSPCGSMHGATCILYIQGKVNINNNLF